jgi:hypothetical protein
VHDACRGRSRALASEFVTLLSSGAGGWGLQGDGEVLLHEKSKKEERTMRQFLQAFRVQTTE